MKIENKNDKVDKIPRDGGKKDEIGVGDGWHRSDSWYEKSRGDKKIGLFLYIFNRNICVM